MADRWRVSDTVRSSRSMSPTRRAPTRSLSGTLTPDAQRKLAALQAVSGPSSRPPTPISPGGGGGGPPSVWGQIKRQVAGIPQGIAGLVTGGAQTLATVPHLAYDAAFNRDALRENLDKAGGSWERQDVYSQDLMSDKLREYMVSTGRDPDAQTGGFYEFANQYSPLGAGTAESIQFRSAPRLAGLATGDVSRYREASDQGQIVPAILEDLGNIALVGGAASKAFGALGTESTVANRAVAAAVEGRVPLRSVGAAAAEGATARPLIMPRMPRSMTVTDAGQVIENTATAAIRGGTGSGTGLAGMAARAGNEGLARGLAAVGTGARRITRLADATDNLQFAYPVQGGLWALRKAGVTPGLSRLMTSAATRLSQGDGALASLAEQWTPAYREAARNGTAAPVRVRDALGKEIVQSDRAWLEAPTIAQRYDVSEVQARAATFDVDDRFMGAVDAYRGALRRGMDPTTASEVIGRSIERGYENVQSELRPTIDDIVTFADWKAGKLDPTQSAAMDQIEEAIREGSARYTEQVVKTRALSDEQLKDEWLPSEVEVIRRDIEKARDAGPGRDQYKQAEEFDRAQRLYNATAALNDRLPPPADIKVARERGRKLGIAQERAIVLRNEYRARLGQLEKAKMAYDEGIAVKSPALDRLAKEVDHYTEQVTTLRREIDRTTRQRDATHVLSRVEGLSDPKLGEGGEPSPRPDVKLTIDDTQKAMRDTAVELRREATQEAADFVESVTGGDRLRTPTDAKARNVAEAGWDPIKQTGDAPNPEHFAWWNELPKGVREWALKKGYLVPRWDKKYKGKGLDGKQVPKRYQAYENVEQGMTPDILAQRMSDRLGRNLSTDDALRMYFDAIEGEYRAGLKANDAVYAQIAEDVGLPRDLVAIAIDGTMADFKDALRDYTVTALDDVQTAFSQMNPALQEAVLDELRSMREGNATPEEMGDLIWDALDMEGKVDILEPIWGRVDMTELSDWLTGRATPRAVYEAVLGNRPAAARKQIVNLQKRINTLRTKERSAAATESRLTKLYDAAQQATRAGDVRRTTRLADAAGVKADAAATTATNMGEAVKISESVRDPWKRRKGSRVVGKDADGNPIREQTNPRSTMERIYIREGVLRERMAARAAAGKRTMRSINKYNDRIANLPGELGRGFTQRLREDINTPAIASMRGGLRNIEKPFGGLPAGLRDSSTPIELTGVVGEVARRNDISDMVIDRLMSAQEAAGGIVMPIDARRIVQQVADDYGVKFDEHDMRLLDLSSDVDQIIYEVDQIVQAGIDNGTELNTPLRVIDHIRAYNPLRRDMGPEGKSIGNDYLTEIERRFDTYMRKRNAHLTNLMDNQAIVMPGRWRAVGSNSRRLVRGLLDEAEDMYRQGDPDAAALLMSLAEDVPTTLDAMIKAGLDPDYLTGGEAPTRGQSLSSSGIDVTTLRAEHRLTEGTRPMSLSGVTRLQMNQSAKLLTNRAAEFITDNLGKRADTVVGDAINAWFEAHPTDTVVPQADMRRAIEDAGYTQAPGQTGWTRETVIIPKSIAKELRVMSGPTSTMWKFLNKGNRWFKTSVLPLSPKWMTGNIVGNAFMATFNGGMGPVQLARTLDEIASMEGGWAAFYSRGGLPSWAPDELASHGLTYNEHVLRWGDTDPNIDGLDDAGIKQKFENFIGKSYNLNEFVDNATRSAVYLAQLRKGGTPEAALKHTLNAMGDFTRMTPFERRWVREVFPFYSWLRHQTQAALRLPLTDPMRAAYLLSLTNMMNDPEYGEDMLALLGSKIPLGGDRFINIGGLSPFGSPFDLPLDPSRPDLLASNISPVIDAPIRALTGFDVGRLGPVSRPNEQESTDRFGRTIPTSPLRRFAGGVFSGDFGQAANAVGEVGFGLAGELPQTRALRDLALAAGDGELGDYRTGSGDRGNPDYDKPRSLYEVMAGALNVPWPTTTDVSAEMREQAKRAREERARNR